jgi:DNA-binding response OmpR family regulator
MDPAILLVDDIEDNRITLAMRLETCGYSKLIMAASGRQALEKMRAQPVDLVLLDIMMPDTDGYAVLQEMSTDSELRNIPILMISANEDIKSVVRCIELGATDYLTKPFNPVVLKARIDKCIEQAHYGAEETAYHQNIEKERRCADQILSAVLPRSVARELKHRGRLQPRLYDSLLREESLGGCICRARSAHRTVRGDRQSTWAR